MSYPTHYEIGKAIAKTLGYKITNPNDDGKTYYINGINIFGEAGWITIHKEGENVVLEEPARKK